MADTSKRDYTKFNEHVDNSLETVQGKHINDIQDALNDLQNDNIEVHGRVFLEEALFTLEHNPYINYMHYIDLENGDQILRSLSSNWSINTEEQCVYITPPNSYAILHTIALKSEYSDLINNIILRADAEIPRGAIIRYFVSNDMQNYHPVQEGASLPFEFNTYGENLYLKIEIVANSRKESPNLFAVALFCSDKLLEAETLINDSHLVPGKPESTISSGDIVITYDEDDTVLKVEKVDGTSIVELEYNAEGEFVAADEITLNGTVRTEIYKDTQDRVNVVRTIIEEN